MTSCCYAITLSDLLEKAMKNIIIALLSLTVFVSDLNAEIDMDDAQCHQLLNFKANKLRSSDEVDFCKVFNGKALLIVNTASKCGYTPQFKGLEKLHQQYGDKLAVIGFPSGDFRQEHSDTEQVAEVCFINYGVTFTMVEPSRVKGDTANALFKSLSEATGKQPSWNFTKYLVSADGKKIKHFSSAIKPNDERLIQAIESL
jgi:glutathione peroxidase